MKTCILCQQPTNGSVGAAGLKWDRICQPCKDKEDQALSQQLRAMSAALAAVVISGQACSDTTAGNGSPAEPLAADPTSSSDAHPPTGDDRDSGAPPRGRESNAGSDVSGGEDFDLDATCDGCGGIGDCYCDDESTEWRRVDALRSHVKNLRTAFEKAERELVEARADLDRIRGVPFERGPDGEPNGPDLGAFLDVEKKRDQLRRESEQLKRELDSTYRIVLKHQREADFLHEENGRLREALVKELPCPSVSKDGFHCSGNAVCSYAGKHNHGRSPSDWLTENQDSEATAIELEKLIRAALDSGGGEKKPEHRPDDESCPCKTCSNALIREQLAGTFNRR